MSLFSNLFRGSQEDKNEVSALELSIAVKYEAGQHKEVVAEATSAIRQFPRQASFYYLRAISREDLQEWEAAILDYDRYLELSPNQYNALFRKGLCYQQSGRPNEAIRCYDAAVEHFGNVDTPLTRVYTEIMQLQGRKASRNWFSIGKEQILNNRAVLKAKSGDLKGAIEDFDEAISISPDYANSYKGRGTLLYQTGKDEEGKRDLRRAAELGDQQAQMALRMLGG